MHWVNYGSWSYHMIWGVLLGTYSLFQLVHGQAQPGQFNRMISKNKYQKTTGNDDKETTFIQIDDFIPGCLRPQFIIDPHDQVSHSVFNSCTVDVSKPRPPPGMVEGRVAHVLMSVAQNFEQQVCHREPSNMGTTTQKITTTQVHWRHKNQQTTPFRPFREKNEPPPATTNHHQHNGASLSRSCAASKQLTPSWRRMGVIK